MITKKFLSLLVALALVFTLVPVSSFADAASDEIISKGIGISEAYIKAELQKLHEDGGVRYGAEWYIIAMLRAGKTVDDEILNEYYESLCDEVKKFGSDAKPTDMERMSLALTVMGKDITNIDDVNLAELIYNSPRLSEGSNELAYALIALDAAKTEIPADALWNREKITEELLKFRTSDGGFGLSDNISAEADITAICLQALAPYIQDLSVNSAAEGALTYLKSLINSDFNCADNPNSTAQILLSLATLKIDVSDTSNGFSSDSDSIIDALYSYRNPDGDGYLYDNEINSLATVQIMQAFDAYRKSQKEDVLYWDFKTAGAIYDDEITTGDSETGSDAAEPIVVYVTIASEGTVVTNKNGGYMAQIPVTVNDINYDGKLNVHEVLYAAHKDYYDGGVRAGYSTFNGPYGLSLAILWGKGTENVTASAGYWLNNNSCWSLTDEVSAGDYLTAFNYYDAIYFADSYSYFTQNSVSVTAGSSVTLSLKYVGYDEFYTPVISPCIGAKIKFIGLNSGTLPILTTNSDGTAKADIPKSLPEGSYYVMAYKDNASIVPSVCKINVSAAKNYVSGSSGGGISVFTVNFNTNGAGEIKKQSIRKNSTVTRPQDPAMDGYTFEGWYTDEELSNKYDFTLKVTSDLTLYAKWNKTADISGSDAQINIPSFTDVEKSSWYEEAVIFAVKNNLFKGVSETEFAPNDNMTRAMLVTVLHRLSSSDGEAYENKFTDVTKEQWYYDAVCWAAATGVTSGINETEFAPDEIITREQLATILYRYACVMEYDVSSSAELEEFDDHEKISIWALDAFKWASGAELIKGTDNVTLSPQISATRAQVAAILMRFYQNIKK